MIRRQLATFLAIGCLTMAVDYLTYFGLVRGMGVPIDFGKAAGFVVGTACAYFANRRWTFAGQAHRPAAAGRFVALYGATLLANVGVNALMFRGLEAGASAWALQAAFVVATGITAVLNFAGMKWYVFRPASR